MSLRSRPHEDKLGATPRPHRRGRAGAAVRRDRRALWPMSRSTGRASASGAHAVAEARAAGRHCGPQGRVAGDDCWRRWSLAADPRAIWDRARKRRSALARPLLPGLDLNGARRRGFRTRTGISCGCSADHAETEKGGVRALALEGLQLRGGSAGGSIRAGVWPGISSASPISMAKGVEGAELRVQRRGWRRAASR